MADRPGHVCLVEVGPRAACLPPPERAELVERLVLAGLQDIHLGPASQPAVLTTLARLPRRPGLRFPVQVDHPDQLDRALTAGAGEIELAIPASGRLCRATCAVSREAWLRRLEPVAALASEHGLRLRGLVRAAVVCPLQGPLPPRTAAEMSRELSDLGCYEVSLAEDTGEATPDQVRAVWDACGGSLGPDRLALRLRHGPRSGPVVTALLDHGLQTIDTAIGGLDGQPSGTVATEDVAGLLHDLDVATWIDPGRLAETAWWLGSRLGRAPAAHRTRWPRTDQRARVN